MTLLRTPRPWLPDMLLSNLLQSDIADYPATRNQSSDFSALNIVEHASGYRLELAVPGLSKEDIKLDVDNENKLTISAEKKIETEEKSEKYLRKEFSYTQFKRAVFLPENANVDAISASCNNGVLSVEVPVKSEEEVRQSKIIDVK